MKKSLIALAALAATGAAFAQSSVTLSGTVDTGIQKTGSGQPVQMVASRLGTSAWTLAGTEDLGGGLKAIFKVSTSFNSDDGTTAGNVLGNNDMFVGLQGGFGSLKLGRSFNPTFFYALTANSTKGVTGYSTRAGTLATDGVYVSNQVLYSTPNMSGFTAQVSYAPSEATGSKAHTGLGAGYANGPLAVNLAYSKLAGVNVKALTLVSAAYDFGVARVLFAYTDREDAVSTADNTWALGVTAPVGPGQLWASYDRSEATNNNTKVFHGGYKYNLSKRTTAYVNLGNKKVGNAKATNGYGIGVAHNF